MRRLERRALAHRLEQLDLGVGSSTLGSTPRAALRLLRGLRRQRPQIGVLLHDRARLRERGLSPASEESVLRVWRWLAERPALFRLAIGAARLHARMLGQREVTQDGDRAWLTRAPGPGAGWTATRDLGFATGESFREWFAKRDNARGVR